MSTKTAMIKFQAVRAIRNFVHGFVMIVEGVLWILSMGMFNSRLAFMFMLWSQKRLNKYQQHIGVK